MSLSRERDEFVARMVKEGLDVDTIRTILRNASTIQRCAVLACSSEAADRDRMPCPGAKREERCVCDMYQGEHNDVPRIAVTEWRAQRRIDKVLEGTGVKANFQGDPRGCCVKLQVPSGKTDDWGGTGICVPTPRY